MRVAKPLALMLLAVALASCTAPTFHKSYEAAAVVGSEPPKKGVILHLHGCDGPGRYTAPWFAHLQSLGFLIIEPDSFADPRPAVSCAPHYPRKRQVYNVRRLQTAIAIERIRETYPDAPLFVWGHSEGGSLAYTLNGDFAGVLVTGHACGHGPDARVKVRKDVPLLVIQGTKDPYVPESRALRTCVQLKRSPLWRLVLVDGTGHLPSFYLEETRQPIERFFTEPAARQAKAP